MIKSEGKIIAVVGGPRSGKSFLVKLLAEHYKAVPILEGEEQDFPEQIKEDIAQNIRPLERITWFRNKLVKEYLKALEIKNEGKLVVVDNFWISYQLYIDALAKDFENEIIQDIASIDKSILPWPDVVIFLSLSEEGIRSFIKLGGRTFDRDEEFVTKQAIPVHNLHKNFFTKLEPKYEVITVARDDIDFNLDNHFKSLVQSVDKSLNK